MTLVAGHALLFEGAPFDRYGRRIWRGTSGPGRGKCSCGETSEDLPSGYARRRWHRGHKAEIIEQSSNRSNSRGQG